MRVIDLLPLLTVALAILDRSYYDALCIIPLIQNCPLVQVPPISERPSASSLKSITPTATPVPEDASNRLTWVSIESSSL